MASTFTPNIQLEEPARGDDVGVWDTPVNANMTVTDLVVGGMTTIALNNSPVVLTPAQFQCKTLVFNSTLTGSVTITFPSSFRKSYEIINACTGTSAFTVTLIASNPGVNVIGAKPGEPFDMIWDGAQFRYKNMGPVGSFMDYGGSSYPNWLSVCSIPPLLPCAGGSFSSANYPALTAILGGTTLPDFRGRNASYLNEGTGRLTAAGAGINGDVIFSTGGSNGVTLLSNQIPSLNSVNAAQSITVTSTVAGKAHFPVTGGQVGTAPVPTSGGANAPFSNAGGADWATGDSMIGVNSISVTYANGAQQVVNAPVPLIVAGLRLIRAG